MTITHSAGEYPVNFVNLDQVTAAIGTRDVVVIDSNVLVHYPDIARNQKCVVVPAGEKSKSLARYGKAINELANLKLSRADRLVALGGGVVGDLAGFLAATYMRGISFIQVPTTLLAMVDSSVGGKVGIDLPSGKNLVGAFYPPSEVIICPEFLRTLPKRQFNSGMAEVWKAGFIASPSLISTLRNKSFDIETIIRSAVAIKAKIVMEDEFETKGTRAMLNFGHTVGHAIEAELEYKKLLHGEAVAIGMVVESRIGCRLGLTSAATAEAVVKDMKRQHLPIQIPKEINRSALIERMRLDKKSVGGKIAMSLLTGCGECKLFMDIDPDVIASCL